MSHSCRGLFVTGTDTGVGKTRIAAGIVSSMRARGLRIGAYKPVASGSTMQPSGPVWSDVEILHAAMGGMFPREAICPQCWHEPLAPPVAARREGQVVDRALLTRGAAWWRERVDFLVIEGAGGLLCPLTDSESMADLARELGFPLLVVARLSLGTINHTLLTLEAARSRNLAVAGVILNQATPPDLDDRSAETNPAELSRRAGISLLAVLPYAPEADLRQVDAFNRIDFVGLFADGE